MIQKLVKQAYLHLFIAWKHVGHFTTVEQVVDVFHKGLALDLGVTEQEDSVLGFTTGPAQDALQIVPPLYLSIALGDLHLCHCKIELATDIGVCDGFMVLYNDSVRLLCCIKELVVAQQSEEAAAFLYSNLSLTAETDRQAGVLCMLCNLLQPTHQYNSTLSFLVLRISQQITLVQTA